jgi:superfamily II DNA or RNA helicase
MILRPYQQACHDAVWQAWGTIGPDLRVTYAALMQDIGADPFGPAVFGPRITAEMATSSGKTITAAKIIETAVQMGERCLYVGDTDELVSQPVEKLLQATGIIAAVEKADRRATLNAKVVVGSMQSFSKVRMERFPPGHFQRLIIDEVHRSTDRKARIWDYFSKASVLGLTGTAFRKGMADLKKWLPITAFTLGTFDLIAQGYGTPLKVFRIPVEINAAQLELGSTSEGRDITLDSAASCVTPYLRKIACIIRDHPHVKNRTRTILVFLPLIETSELFARILQEEGVTAMHCDGGTKDRAKILEQFERGTFRVLCNPQTFSTGVDFIRCDCILNLRVTRSPGLFRQIVGRGLRLIPGTVEGLTTAQERRKAISRSSKPDCLILDILWQADSLGIAGPANMADDLDNEKAREFIAGATEEPRDLQEIRERVRKAKEKELAEAIEAQAKRKAVLLDAHEIAARIGRADLVNAMPKSAAMAKAPTGAQIKALATRGVYGDDIKTRGEADGLLEEIDKRTRNGMAPLHTFDALRAKGFDAPETITLDMAVKLLGSANFPVGFGKRAGTPFAQMPKAFWWWVYEKNLQLQNSPKGNWLSNFPAEVRYATHVVAKSRTQNSLAS